ncbi:hypothetical protein BCIN_05g07530 [Botrytis cinerea B05.10]|uniref:Uncharacterized protein n=2 Tax=Botryotinia fuckeliana TaxID=40559 RepID=A0A384JIW5_BOTFB|nr:hypothetical protein BCIN_05g07530 [Botrytis cinerea B05.10]ATZ50401.1 hypothetical protein BCIN_05g07530 [Botrytis cinerea B05.10]CCD44070.1 hypothetical protein BofuT4_P060170.1 [Botrytis cinerea T4]
MNPAPEDSQGAQHGESVQQAVELVGKMLEQIQVELEKMLSQGGKVPPEVKSLENEKEESQKRYKDLESNYQKISEELKAFGRDTINAFDKSGQVRAESLLNQAKDRQVEVELQLAQAEKEVENLKTEVKKLQARRNAYQAKAGKPSQDVQDLEAQLEELKQQKSDLQKDNLDSQQELKQAEKKIVDLCRSLAGVGKATSRPSTFWQQGYATVIAGVQRIVRTHLDLNQNPNIKHGSKQKPRDLMLGAASGKKTGPGGKEHCLERAVFQFLCDEIFLKPGFGLDDEDEGKNMEAGLVEFEQKIQITSAVESPEKIDYRKWRVLTYKCAKRFQKTEAKTNVDAFASALEEFLRPLRKPNDKLLNKNILDLCKTTFSLSQNMRAEHDMDFEIYMPAPGDQVVIKESGMDEVMQIWGEERGHPADVAGTVAYTAMGGLRGMNIGFGVWISFAPARVVVKAI